MTRIVTVVQSTPSQVCLGTQLGTYATSLAGVGACSAPCLLGPASTSQLCGTSLGTPTYCCYRPSYLWVATAYNSPVPGANTAQAYPFMSFTVPTVRRGSWRSEAGRVEGAGRG